MLELRRTVRFCLGDAGSGGGIGSGASGHPFSTRKHNTYSAWPAMRGLGRYYELHIICRGEADPVTGYFLDIRLIDEAVREHVLPDLDGWVSSPTPASSAPMGEVMRRIVTRLDEDGRLRGRVAEVTLQLTPMVSLTMRSDDMDRVILRQSYEFSAAHRLHVPSLGDAQNHKTFGKCNNPAGHGHNYRLDVAVSAPIDPGGDVLGVEELDAIVDEHVVEKLDHKHLNIDVPAFRELNPTVENIVRVVWDMLVPHMEGVGPIGGAALEELTVWETPKTACTYRGPGAAVR